MGKKGKKSGQGKGNQKEGSRKKDITLENLEAGYGIYKKHPLFSRLQGQILVRDKRTMGKKIPYLVNRNGEIYLNQDYFLSPKQWAYGIVHCLLHLAFGHFDAEKMEGCDIRVWNQACDIYIGKFLTDVKFGEPTARSGDDGFSGRKMDEREIYEELLLSGGTEGDNGFMDMVGLERPVIYDKNGKNPYALTFAYALADSASEAVSVAGGHEKRRGHLMGKAEHAAQWFLNHYPLLGGLASAFHIIEDYRICERKEIQVAAVDVALGEIYINPTANLTEEELKFVLAHEYLHAGLQHQERCRGRNPYLWNVACDYVINGWLSDMRSGEMPKGEILYDESLKNLSAEEIYDRILADIRKYERLDTFRGYGKGDFFGDGKRKQMGEDGVTLDEFCKSALSQGLAYHERGGTGRGFIPAGLIEEIRALSMPPIPWDVELARWFDEQFPYPEKKRTYAEPSRRQGATPDIPRPRYGEDEAFTQGRTFGVVTDTSGSMSVEMIGKALGSIASYAAGREVPFARVVFCDAAAYDAGYLSPEEIAGRVEVKGRGGTRLQPGVDLLENAKDFPKDGPILIITDGEIEDRMVVHREHAFLLLKGKRLPFKARGKVFQFS